VPVSAGRRGRGGRAPDLPAWGRKRPGGEERLPWQLGGWRVREVERRSEADNKRAVGPRGGLSGQSGRRHAKRGLGGVVRAAGEAGRGGSTCQTLQLARRRMGRARKRLSKGSWAGPGRSACHGGWAGGGRSREGAGGTCQGSWAGGVLSGGAPVVRTAGDVALGGARHSS
jgi:hypothetical protein